MHEINVCTMRNKALSPQYNLNSKISLQELVYKTAGPKGPRKILVIKVHCCHDTLSIKMHLDS